MSVSQAAAAVGAVQLRATYFTSNAEHETRPASDDLARVFRQLDLLVEYAKLVQLGPPQRSLDELKQQLAKRNAAAHAARIAVFRHAEEPYARGIIGPEEGKLLAWLTAFFGGQLSEARLADLAGYLGQQSSVGRRTGREIG
jgi:hypothetical protein